MHDGIVEQIGAPLELYDRPDNLFVAGFIGSPGDEFHQGHDVPAIPSTPMAVSHLPVGAHPGRDRGPAARLRACARSTSASIRPGVPAEVVAIEPTGSETQVVLRAGGQDIIAVFRERMTAKPGEMIPIAPTPCGRASLRRRIRKAPRRLTLLR